MDSLRGTTLRWSFADGPMAGTLVEHTLHDDGGITWRILEGQGEGVSAREQHCASMQVADNVHTVSYLAASGHTLTVVLNLTTGRVFGFGSNDKAWHAMTGTFEVVQ